MAAVKRTGTEPAFTQAGITLDADYEQHLAAEAEAGFDPATLARRPMGTSHGYTRESLIEEFFPDPDERREVEAGADRLIAANRAHRLAEMRRRLGLAQAEESA